MTRENIVDLDVRKKLKQAENFNKYKQNIPKIDKDAYRIITVDGFSWEFYGKPPNFIRRFFWWTLFGVKFEKINLEDEWKNF